MLTGQTMKGSLVNKLLRAGHCPLGALFVQPLVMKNTCDNNGIVDSLKYLVLYDNLIKPWSNEHVLTTHLTKA